MIIEVISALLDEVFDDRYLPAEIKTVFGRLQIAILKATLLDPSVLANPRHRVRQFFETLAAASVGLRPDDEYDVLFIELADHLATLIRDHLANDLSVFDTAREQLDTFLDAERAAYNKKLAEALPLLLAQDEYTNAERAARTALAAHLGERTCQRKCAPFSTTNASSGSPPPMSTTAWRAKRGRGSCSSSTTCYGASRRRPVAPRASASRKSCRNSCATSARAGASMRQRRRAAAHC